MFVRLQAIYVADNFIKVGDGASDRHCSHNFYIGDLITGHVTFEQGAGMENNMMAFITVSVLLVFFILLLISIPRREKKGDAEGRMRMRAVD